MPVFTAKQTHLCPRHRRTRRHFSPSPLSGGESACLSHSDTCRVLQPGLGNCLVGLISFAGKTGFFPPRPGFTPVGAIPEMKPVRGHSPRSPLHREDLPLASRSQTDLRHGLGWLLLGEVSCPPERRQQSWYPTALNPDGPLSLLTSGAVFCHPSLENGLPEGPAPGWG